DDVEQEPQQQRQAHREQQQGAVARLLAQILTGDDRDGAHAQSRSARPVRWRNTASRFGSRTSTERTVTPACPAVVSSLARAGRASGNSIRTCDSTLLALVTSGRAARALVAAARSPSAASTTSSLLPTSRTSSRRVPSAFIWPWSMMPTRSQSRSA